MYANLCFIHHACGTLQYPLKSKLGDDQMDLISEEEETSVNKK